MKIPMATMIATGCKLSRSVSVQDKGSRNKRKFSTEDPNKVLLLQQMDSVNCGLGNSHNSLSPKQDAVCDSCDLNHNLLETFTPSNNLSGTQGSCNLGCGGSREELEVEESQDADWSDTTQSQLVELVLSNLDMIFKSAIKKVVSHGYVEEVAMKAVSRMGVCYGCKDTVTNIVDNALSFLKNGQEVVSSRELHSFEDLQQLERYVLAEMVSVLREVRPFFSTGDAMWWLLMCDMNMSHACAMDGDSLNCFCGDEHTGSSSIAMASQKLKLEDKSSIPTAPELDIPKLSKPNHSIIQAKERTSLSTDVLEESSTVSEECVSTISQLSVFRSSAPEDKSNGCRKVRTNNSRRESALRQKPIHLEKTYRAYGSKGALRSGKLNGLTNFLSDMKYKSVPSSTSDLKNASLNISKAVVADSSQTEGNTNPFIKVGSSSKSCAEVEAGDTTSSLPLASTKLSLSSPSGSNDDSKHECNVERTNCDYCGISTDKVLGQWFLNNKDEMLLKLIRVRELQTQMQEWTEWAQQKVMQAARRLSKDTAELKALRQEKEEVARLIKEKQALEDNTMKKLAEMENALCKAGGQVERANAAVHRLEVENCALRQEMENAKLQAAKSALSCQEAIQKEKNTLKEFQSWERQKNLLEEELVTEKHKVSPLQQEVEKVKEFKDHFEARRKQEEKVKEEVLRHVTSARKEREQIMEALAKSNEDMIKEENNLQRNKEEVQRLEKEIAPLSLKTNFPKMAALRWETGVTYASHLADIKNVLALKETNPSCIPETITYASCLKDAKSAPALKDTSPNSIPEMITYASCVTDVRSIPLKDTIPNCNLEMKNIQDFGMGDVQRERECVMCLTDEMSVVFLPCAHQVVCLKCNELHEKQGMKGCPSCRTPIQRRICVRLANYQRFI